MNHVIQLVLVVLLGAPPQGFLAGGLKQDKPVAWQFSLDRPVARRGEQVTVRLRVSMREGWYIYSHELKGVGPQPTEFSFDLPAGLGLLGPIVAPEPRSKYDQGFERQVEYYSGDVVFEQKVVVGDETETGTLAIRGSVRFQACNDRTCLPPRTVEFALDLRIEPGPSRVEFRPREAVAPPRPGQVVSTGTRQVGATEPIAAEVEQARASGFLAFLMLAFVQGFLALFTPCVYPMIPITVSFFVKQGEREGRRPFLLATTYVGSIMATFVAVGLLLTLIVGPTGASRLGSHPLANLFLGALFVAFALNLFGLFEVRIPASLQNYFAGKGQGGGYVGTAFMGLAFTLASLTCTAPFIGALLAMAATGEWFWPLVGMLGFSATFSLPFFFLAVFPQYLARMPKSGAWMNSVKVVMGYFVLAVGLKFLGNADLVWDLGIFGRNQILAAWATISAFAGLYLLGLFRLPADQPAQAIGALRMLLSLVFLAFGLYLAGGLFGARLGSAIDVFLPPPEPSATIAAGPGAAALQWLDDYSRALERARAERKPIFINFTGVTCTNCKWMEQNVFPRDDVRQRLRRFILVRLYTDSGPHRLANSKLQVGRFGTNALPLYVIMSSDDKEIARFEGMTRDPQRFIDFLDRGLAGAAEAAP